MEIKIELEDDKEFACAAFILDQDELLNKIFEIRLYWELRDHLILHENFDEWYSEHKDDFSLTPQVANYWGVLPDFSFTNPGPGPNLETIQKITDSNHIELELEHLLRTSGLKSSFKQVVLKAIVCGEIKLKDWLINKNDEKFYSEDSFFNIPNYEKVYKGATKPEIKRDREWYWKVKRGATPMQIAKKASKKKKWIVEEDFRQKVKNGIIRYKLFLKNQGTFKTSF